MTISEQIRILCVRTNMNSAELVHRLDTTLQNFNVKLKRESFTVAELEKIAQISGGAFEINFKLDNGETV